MRCSAGGEEFNLYVDGGATLVMNNGTIYRLCVPCLDYLWKHRSPDYKALKKGKGKGNAKPDALPVIPS